MLVFGVLRLKAEIPPRSMALGKKLPSQIETDVFMKQDLESKMRYMQKNADTIIRMREYCRQTETPELERKYFGRDVYDAGLDLIKSGQCTCVNIKPSGTHSQYYWSSTRIIILYDVYNKKKKTVTDIFRG